MAVDFGDKDAYLFYSYHRDQPKNTLNISFYLPLYHLFLYDWSEIHSYNWPPFTLNFDDQFHRTTRTRPFILIFFINHSSLSSFHGSFQCPQFNSNSAQFLHNQRTQTRALFVSKIPVHLTATHISPRIITTFFQKIWTIFRQCYQTFLVINDCVFLWQIQIIWRIHGIWNDF